MSETPQTVYEAAGGDATFRRLVDTFYEGVETEPILRPLYPADLTESREHLFLFLIQYFGGPPRYNALRGHPRLRMRHMPFPIGARERDAWLHHMRHAVEATGFEEPVREVLLRYFDHAANFLVNQPG
jgi:hemoglobin